MRRSKHQRPQHLQLPFLLAAIAFVANLAEPSPPLGALAALCVLLTPYAYVAYWLYLLYPLASYLANAPVVFAVVLGLPLLLHQGWYVAVGTLLTCAAPASLLVHGLQSDPPPWPVVVVAGSYTVMPLLMACLSGSDALDAVARWTPAAVQVCAALAVWIAPADRLMTHAPLVDLSRVSMQELSLSTPEPSVVAVDDDVRQQLEALDNNNSAEAATTAIAVTEAEEEEAASL